MRPVRTTWCESSWENSTPATMTAKTGTPVRHSFLTIGGGRACFGRTLNPRFTFMYSVSRFQGASPNRRGVELSPLARSRTTRQKLFFDMSRPWPAADRLELLRATRAHFGQLFMLYSDPAGEIDGLLQPGGNPDLETQDEYGVSHRVWKIADPQVISQVQTKMHDKKLVIADGHHRYETALNYRNEQRKTNGTQAGATPSELVMMTLVNMDSPGLVVLPTHRVVHGLDSFSAAAFREGASPYFSCEEVDTGLDRRARR